MLHGRMTQQVRQQPSHGADGAGVRLQQQAVHMQEPGGASPPAHVHGQVTQQVGQQQLSSGAAHAHK